MVRNFDIIRGTFQYLEHWKILSLGVKGTAHALSDAFSSYCCLPWEFQLFCQESYIIVPSAGLFL